MYINNYSVSRSGHNFVGSIIKSWFPDEIININSYENIIISEVKENNIKEGPKILVIRNFLNWVASYHTFISGILDAGDKEKYNITFNNVLKVYKELIEEYVKSKYYNTDVKIYYDRFKVDENYRRGICDKLGGKYTEIAMEFVPNAGNASSFDKDRFQGRGSMMETSTRYQQVDKHKEEYINILRNNRDLIESWSKEFGITKEEYEFINNL